MVVRGVFRASNHTLSQRRQSVQRSRIAFPNSVRFQKRTLDSARANAFAANSHGNTARDGEYVRSQCQSLSQRVFQNLSPSVIVANLKMCTLRHFTKSELPFASSTEQLIAIFTEYRFMRQLLLFCLCFHHLENHKCMLPL